MAKIDVQATIEETADLLAKKDELQTQIADNRFLLRAAVRSKQATKEQAEWVEKEFPTQATKTPEERVQARREALEDAERKAKEAAAKSNSKATRSRAAA